jgi:hypothetical protein
VRRILALVALAIVAGAYPATAQQTVRGGVSFRRAPALEPGEHRDTIRPGETLFYAVEVDEGELFTVRAILRSRDRLQPLETRVRVYNSQRVEDPFAQDAGFLRAPGTLGLHVRSGAVGASSVDYPAAGGQYFSVSVGSPRGRVGAEIDLALSVKLKPAPEHELSIVETPPPAPAPEPESRGGTYLLAGFAGALVGGVVAFAASKLRQAPSGLRHRL